MSLTNTQYDTIMRQYEAKQTKNRHLTEQRILEVYEKEPRLKELDAAISTCSVKQAKLLLDGDEHALTLLKEEIKELVNQKSNLLKGMGYPSDYLKTTYHCKDCKDTGYRNNKKCHCFLQASIDMVYAQSNMRKVLERENFRTFSYAYYSSDDIDNATGLSSLDTIKSTVNTCQTFISQFDTVFGNLFFYGDTGVGKTFLSNCIAKELLDSGHSVIYVTASQLFQVFEKNTFRKGEGGKEEYQNLFTCDMLIIDDLGAELSNTFTTSQLFLCLNERILREKSVIISTNLNMKQLADTYSERIFSRISSHYTMIKLFGSDIRIIKKLKGHQ